MRVLRPGSGLAEQTVVSYFLCVSVRISAFLCVPLRLRVNVRGQPVYRRDAEIRREEIRIKTVHETGIYRTLDRNLPWGVTCPLTQER